MRIRGRVTCPVTLARACDLERSEEVDAELVVERRGRGRSRTPACPATATGSGSSPRRRRRRPAFAAASAASARGGGGGGGARAEPGRDVERRVRRRLGVDPAEHVHVRQLARAAADDAAACPRRAVAVAGAVAGVGAVRAGVGHDVDAAAAPP